ncbi:AAA family ATPase [Candidatus Woesearchaeota archaeon]|nr:AAA family ATPase [Candidatus Woesearchaeota archaeon]
MIITISGTPGSGKSTVAKILAERLQAERIYVGGIRRELAKKKNMTLQELNIYAETHPETDVDIDTQVAAEARTLEKKEKNVLVEGRTQFHFLPKSVKLYLKVDLQEAARRIWKDLQQEAKKKERNEGNVHSLAEMKKALIQREENDAQRYKKYYGFDHRNEKQYDLVIDTTKIKPEEVVEKILAFIDFPNRNRSRNKNKPL